MNGTNISRIFLDTEDLDSFHDPRSPLMSDFNDSVYFNESQLLFNTTSSDGWRSAIKPVLDILLVMILIMIMLAMGCEIQWQNLLNHIKKPIGLSIGALSQFVVMPAVGFCVSLISGISAKHATGVLIISCSPGGVLSNTFTYFCDGDLSLSVAMTCASTLIAMGMMPLNMWLYGRHFEVDGLVIPYKNMAISLISITSPVIVGMIIKWKLPKVAAFTVKAGSYLAYLITFACIVMEVMLFPNMFSDVPIKVYLAIFTIPAIGLTLGYGISFLLKQNKEIRKTIAIECGVQNVPIALTIVALSFPIEMQESIILLPLLYAVGMMSGCTVICIAYHCFSRLKKTDAKLQTDITEKEDTLLDQKEVDQMKEIKIEFQPNVVKNGKQIHKVDYGI